MKRRIFIAALTLGLSGLVAEILLLRELLIVFSGNELCIGIILANWLILEAFGSYILGRKAETSRNQLETFSVVTILFSISLIFAIFLTRVLKRSLGISIGEAIGFVPMFYTSFLILLPASVFHGALFTFCCRIYATHSGQDASATGRIYVYETVGTIIGGIACTYLLIPFLNSFQAATGLALLNFAVCLVIVTPYWKTGPYQKFISGILGGLVIISGYLVFTGQVNELHDYSIKLQWKNQNLVHYQNSQYGNICVIENQGQYIFFLDGMPGIITPVPDIPFVEEFVHLPLLAHPEPAKLLILSGGAGGIINEALKHPSIETIEYAELDPLLLDLLRKFPTPLTESELSDSRIKIRHIDGFLWLKTERDRYDLIFVGILEPSSLQTNRFFTKEFFSLAKKRLNKGGILVIGLPGSLTYRNDELKNLNSSIFNTLNSIFPYIWVIPGDGTNLFLSSDSQEVTTIDRTQVIKRMNQRQIKANVVVPRHIENKLHRGWQNWFARFIDGGSRKINSEFKPVGLYYSISHWNALHTPSLRWLFRQFERISLRTLGILSAIFFILYFFSRSKRLPFFQSGIPYSIITTGFAGMIFELMLIFYFQSVYGHVFSWIGLLVAAFMAGAACGAMIMTRVMGRLKNCFRMFVKTELSIICFSIGCPLLFLAIHAYPASLGVFFVFRILFLVISFICGVLIGAQFPLANKIYLGRNASLTETAGLLYASDLLGGWFGGIIGAVVLLPVLGLTGTCTTVALLKLTSFVVITTQPNRHR